MNNKIDTSIQTNRYFEQNLRNEIAKQDVYKSFVLNANSIAPQEQRAYLLKTRNPISSFIIATADTGKDIVELSKALVTGKSNDNQLGRFNDLGMKLGSLGIASYLFTRRATGTKGILEFLGAGAFFASMAAWPRLLISEPLKFLYGFDIRQQYVDAQGRKKRLYLDNQFIPDLYSDEEIDKIADKMGIDKSNSEYRELTKEKMRTIALQGNTLWMLSAGFSPLLTSMVCNVAERGVTKYIINSQYNKIMKKVDDLEKIAKERQLDAGLNVADFKQIKHILETRVSEPDEAFYRKVSNLLDPFSALINAKDIDDANLISELGGAGHKIRQEIQNIYNSIKAEKGQSGIIETDSIIAVAKKYLNGAGDLQGNTYKTSAVREMIAQLIHSKGKDNERPFINVEDFKRIFNDALQKADPKEAEKLKKAYKECLSMQIGQSELVEEFCAALEKIYTQQTRPISAKVLTYSDFINGLVGQKYESLHTGIHLSAVNSLMEFLNVPYKDLKIARGSLDRAREILQGNLKEIASDDQNYSKFISSLTSKQAKFEASTVDKLLSSIKQKATQGLVESFSQIQEDSPLAVFKSQVDIDMNKLKELVENTFKLPYEKFAEIYGKENITKDDLIKLLISKGVPLENEVRSPMFKRILNMFIDEKGAGIRATGHRYILEADFERRLQTGELQNYWKHLTGHESISDEVLKACRSIIYDGSMNDLANKFYQEGNGISATKILKLIFGETGLQGEDAMRAGLSKLTYESCDKAMVQKLVETRENFYKIYAQMLDFARPGQKIAGVGTDALQKVQYSMLGKSGTELFMETASKKFNDKTWMRMFGGFLGVVVGVVLISQFFFGKVKNEHLYKKEKGGVNAGK